MIDEFFYAFVRMVDEKFINYLKSHVIITEERGDITQTAFPLRKS